MGFFGWNLTLGFWHLLYGVIVYCTAKKEFRNKSLSLYIVSSLLIFLVLFLGAPFSGVNESLEINKNSSRYILSWYFLALFFSWTGIFAY